MVQANTAWDLANTKQGAFTQTTESFIGVHGNANSPINVSLAHIPKSGMELMVFFNGVRVKNV